MPNSMTGFGRGEASHEGARIVVEVRGVNHRYCEVAARVPRELSGLEDRVRQWVQQRIARGRLEVSSAVDFPPGRSQTVSLDTGLAEIYLAGLAELKERLGLPDRPTLEQVARVPGVIGLRDQPVEGDGLWEGLEKALQDALAQFIGMRRDEGERLAADLRERVGKLRGLAEGIGSRAPGLVDHYRVRLADRMRELSLAGPVVDEWRLAAEVAFMAERSDISEEVVRFLSHLEEMDTTLNLSEPVGRKLEFLVQELHREANTMSSKAHDFPISRDVVEIKNELEKIREQVQNLE
ncbi:MAG: YicC family protein [Firmicutes bacterium]|nr:YicC family protein [Bacillota bacterium]